MDKQVVVELAREILLATARIETNGIVHARPDTCFGIADAWIKYEQEYLAEGVELEAIG